MNNWTARIRAFATETWQEWRDIAAAVVDVWNGKPKDPKEWAEKPPTFWFPATPESDVPKRKQKSVEVEFDAYTPEEILAMTESEYGTKVGLLGVHSWKQAQKLAKQTIEKRRKSNAREVEY